MNLRARPLPALMATLLFLALAGCGKSPEAHLKAGSALLEQNDYKAAILELKSVLQEEPGNRDARLLLGKAYLANESYADAEKELTKAREQGASNDDVLPVLAKALLNQDQAQKVLELALPSAVMSKQSIAIVQLIRAEAFLRLNKELEATHAIALAEQADPKQPDFLLLKARLAAKKHLFPDARQLADEALKGNPKLLDAYYLKAALYETEGNPDLAIKEYERAILVNPKAYRAHLAISDIQFVRGQKVAGEASLKAAEAVAPNALFVKFARGIHELRSNNLKAANESLTQFLKVAPGYLPAQIASAMTNLGLGNHEQSLKQAQLVLSREPGNVIATRVLAASQLKAGDAKEALATLTPLLKSRPDDPQILALAGEASLQNKDYRQALGLLAEAESFDPNYPELKNKQVAGLLALGQTEQAIAELQASIKLSGQATLADVSLVSINLKRKDFDKALQAIDALERKIPGKPIPHNLRAVALLGKNDVAGARKSLDKAVSLDPTYYPAVSNLARLDLAENKPEVAKQRFESMLSKVPNSLPAMLALAELAKAGKQEMQYVGWLEKAAKANPKALEPKALLARYYLSQKNASKAVASATDALNNNPDDLRALNLLGATQMASKDVQAGLRTYLQLVEKSPESAEAHLLLAVAQVVAGKANEARSSLNQALKIKPDFVDAMDAFLGLEVSSKNPEAALQWARKIQSAQPGLAFGFEREGDLLMGQDKFSAAAKAYQQAFEKAASTQGAIKLHAALSRSGNGAEGLAKLNAWLKLHPEDLQARRYFAGQAMKAGQDKLAMEQYALLLRKMPEDGMVLNNLATLYQSAKDPRALKIAEKAYQVLPNSPAVLDTYGWTLVENGQPEKGVAILEKALSQAKSNLTIQYHFAVGLVRSGNNAKAKSVLQEILTTKTAFAEQGQAKLLLDSLK